ncbi:helix-turn-helix domain-containing protein [Escherichia coli]|nr:helix-turn-helix domain-containing protein [Escherichia coli]
MSMELMVKAMKIRVGNPLRKLVLIKLADNASDQGECWPSYQHIADQCEISKRSVMNHIAALCESGLVKKVTRKGEKGNSSNIYLLHLDGAGDSLGGSANNSLSGAANSPGSAGVAPGGSAGDSPRTSHSFEPVKEPVNEPIAVGASADESVRVRSNRPEYSPEFEQAWLAYPKRAGGNSKSAAFKAWKARLNEGVNPETMLEGVKRYIRECLQWMIDDGVVSRIDLDIRRTGINELGNSITLWRRDGPVMISFDDLWSAITHGGQ